MNEVRVFIGHDYRQPLSYNVMRYSIERHGSSNVVVRGLFLDKLPIKRVGASDFTYTRFLVPWLCDYQGYAIFCDEDQVVVDDISNLLGIAKAQKVAVSVNQDQPRFEWPSVMVFDCTKCHELTPEYIEGKSNNLYNMAWADGVGSFPPEWNHAVGIAATRQDAKLYHFTQGIPYWPECRGLPEDKFWWQEYEHMIKSVQWLDMHGKTVHFNSVIKRMLGRYGVKLQEQTQ